MSGDIETDVGFAQLKQAVLLFKKRTTQMVHYGTAGFRMKADELDWIVFRMGVLAALYSKHKEDAVAVMITASHNPEEDNGMKLIGKHGEMLELEWEEEASSLVNIPDVDFVTAVTDLINRRHLRLHASKALVLCARDTRPSGLSLCDALKGGVESIPNSSIYCYGVLTTPQLHFIVDEYNKSKAGSPSPSDEGKYMRKLSRAFVCGVNMCDPHYKSYSPFLVFDGANGVGGLKMKTLNDLLDPELLKVDIFNNGEGTLNHLCGADFVKIQQKACLGLPEIKPGTKCVSVDGDADRLVYFYFDRVNTFHLLDGDKIASLLAECLQEHLKSTNLKLKLGVVQTAYANGASTEYMKEVLKVPVACVPTGVKHLHKKAEEYDIGVYFEANGHGTVLFSAFARQQITDANARSLDGNKANTATAFQRLYSIMSIINETVGDALADMLCIEYILRWKDWTIQQWDEMYKDFPNRQLKVKVPNRYAFVTSDAERKVVKPKGLQEEIDMLVAKYSKGRSFVRPSGTEDVVRVYAECESQENADSLAELVNEKVTQIGLSG